jgi:hypothetical protein
MVAGSTFVAAVAAGPPVVVLLSGLPRSPARPRATPHSLRLIGVMTHELAQPVNHARRAAGRGEISQKVSQRCGDVDTSPASLLG